MKERMIDMNIEEMKEELSQVLDKKRYRHTIGVAYTSICLAMRYEVDLNKAEIAGLLHDCAKYGSDEKKVKKCEKYGIQLTEVEYQNPALVHAKLGAYLAEHKYGITDEEILSAIRRHTTGAPDMTMLEKIVFLADSIEPGRKTFYDLPVVRKAAFVDIDDAIYLVTKDTLQYLESRCGVVDETTISTYEFYKALYIEKHGKENL